LVDNSVLPRPDQARWVRFPCPAAWMAVAEALYGQTEVA
jgi:hypothetical protein